MSSFARRSVATVVVATALLGGCGYSGSYVMKHRDYGECLKRGSDDAQACDAAYRSGQIR